MRYSTQDDEQCPATCTQQVGCLLTFPPPARVTPGARSRSASLRRFSRRLHALADALPHLRRSGRSALIGHQVRYARTPRVGYLRRPEQREIAAVVSGAHPFRSCTAPPVDHARRNSNLDLGSDPERHASECSACGSTAEVNVFLSFDRAQATVGVSVRSNGTMGANFGKAEAWHGGTTGPSY